MFKKILAFVLLSLIVSCGSSKKHYIQTTKNGTAKNSRKKKTATTGKSTATASNTKKNDNREVEVLESTSKTVVYADLVKQYVLDYKGVAQTNMKKHGIPASIILAQGILESGAGKGTLCVSANNHFGIKCHNDWTGDKVFHDDDSEQECFRKYKQASESFEDHALFLTGRGRYAELFKLEKDDYEGWAKGLRAAGYATDPKYPDKLIGLIERYELAKYDAEVLDKNYTPVVKPVAQKPAPAVVTKPTPAPVVITPVTAPAPVVAPTPAPSPAVAEAIGSVSATVAADSYKVLQGDTLYSISKKHNTTVDALIQLNGLNGNAISIGQVLKVR
jgi:flagellum-specific peptidoglycan hydrolase FlgJ/LysM repeat protein